MAAWVETSLVLADFGADAAKYRGYVEAGQGERQISPFERAVAGLVLGGEAFVKRVVDLPAPGSRPVDRRDGRDARRHLVLDPLTGGTGGTTIAFYIARRKGPAPD